MTIKQQVAEFAAAMDVPSLPSPGIPDDATVRLRARLIMEEAFETLRSMFQDIRRGDLVGDYDWLRSAETSVADFINTAAVRVELPEFADGLADLAYVVEGANQAFGIDSEGVLAVVHAANMAKVGGPIRESDGKRLKPPGWKPPDVAAELERQRREHAANVERANASDLHGLMMQPMAMWAEGLISNGRLRECIREWLRGRRAWTPADFGETQWPHGDDPPTMRAKIDLMQEVVRAARLVRTADTGGGFNDRVACGQALDAALAAYDREARR